MDEPIPIFENKFANYLKQIDDDSKSVSENLRLIADGKVRVGYFNDISERITRMQQTLSAMKHLSIKKEVIGMEIKKRAGNVLTKAIEQVKQDIKTAEDPLGIKEDPFKIR